MSAIDRENDPQWLRQRLRVVTEWHERAEATLAQILRLPDHTRTLRNKIENPAIAVPLMQYYDDTILEKDNEIARLMNENQTLKKQLDNRADDDKDTITNARMREERAQVALEEAHMQLRQNGDEMSNMRAHMNELEQEAITLREKIQHLIVSENRAKDQINTLQRKNEELDASLQDAGEKLHKAREEASVARRQAESAANQRDEESHTSESQKVQLHLMNKENDDKLQEIERLRTKMVSALKQAADNHTTHLQIVEEKHRTVIENLHEQIRAQEATTLKLRAQLSRVDVSSNSVVSSPTAVIESHARSAQEAELRRLYAENTSLQLQRDDALFRVEQIQNSNRHDLDTANRDLRRELESVRHRVRELEDRNTKLESEIAASRESLRRAREEQKSALQAATNAESRVEDLQKQAKDFQRSIQQLKTERDDLSSEKATAVEAERAIIRQLERRVEQMKSDENSEKEKNRNQRAELQRLLDDAKANARDAQTSLASAHRQMQEKDLEIQALNTKVE